MISVFLDNIIVIDILSLYVFIVLIEENFNEIGLFLLDFLDLVLNLMEIIIISVLVVVFIGIIVIFGFIFKICCKR